MRPLPNKRRHGIWQNLLALACLVSPLVVNVQADPCGMIPPIYTGPGVPITRVGAQQTYVFFKDGIETFVIRPGFEGKVDEFGMLIPFPNPPAIRKVPDQVFEHLAAAVDPPEVILNPVLRRFSRAVPTAAAGMEFGAIDALQEGEVHVYKQEAIGMYEVAVLSAGSVSALQMWIDENGYKYPAGMDEVTADYIRSDWCFVAVKTKVGQKQGVDPRPGMRDVTADLPPNSVFDGHVQGMGFRFLTDELTVPMRLSAFNEGELRNIVYLLTDGPRRIRNIPEEYVVRQVDGGALIKNVTQPLPVRVLGMNKRRFKPQPWHQDQLGQRRDPYPHNGVAKELFASDLLAATSKELALDHEETEKELLKIGERFGLRGANIDQLNAAVVKQELDATVNQSLKSLKNMTLTVVDGDFPRGVLAGENLTFAQFEMDGRKNQPSSYDAKIHGPAPEQSGFTIEKLGRVDGESGVMLATLWPIALLAGIPFAFGLKNKSKYLVTGVLIVVTIAVCNKGFAQADADKSPTASLEELVDQLADSENVESVIEQLAALADDSERRLSVIKQLATVAKRDENLLRRGWAIAALQTIGGLDADEALVAISQLGSGVAFDAAGSSNPDNNLVATWAAAARVAMTSSTEALIEKAELIRRFPALSRPIGQRIAENLSTDSDVTAETLMRAATKVPMLQQALATQIMQSGAKELIRVMTQSDDNNLRRQAAGYLGAMARAGDDDVAAAVIDAFQFQLIGIQTPWDGGALFLPGIQWSAADAASLVRNLIGWHIWCGQRSLDAEQRQIHNNLRSLGLANMVGYQTPPGRSPTSRNWFNAWAQAVGKEEARQLLKEIKMEHDLDYASWFQ